MTSIKSIRNGCKDIWNAYMVQGAIFSDHDIPFCPTTAKEIPSKIITFEEAKEIYKQNLRNKNKNFKSTDFVCFYIDDYKFDSTNGIWFKPSIAIRILSHFAGIITPDFSTYQDFPQPLKTWNTYRMRAFGYWYGKEGYQVINNVRIDFDLPELSLEGLPKNDIICIGTVGSNIWKLENRVKFEEYFYKIIEILTPKTILVYGSANYECFQKAKEMGIKVISYPSKTNQVFARRKKHEQVL